MSVRDQDRLGLYVAVGFVAYALVFCAIALFSSPPAPRASSRTLVGVSR